MCTYRGNKNIIKPLYEQLTSVHSYHTVNAAGCFCVIMDIPVYFWMFFYFRLYLRFLSRVPENLSLRKAASFAFHRLVKKSVSMYKECFERWSIRHCAYNATLYQRDRVRQHVALHEVTWRMVVWCTKNLRRDGSSFMWHQPRQRCKYTTSVDMKKKTRYKKLVTHVESHASAVSLPESGEQSYIKGSTKQLLRGGDSSVVRAPDSWLKGRGFESLLERRENFHLQGRLSVLTLISVSVPPPCYHSST